MAGLLLIAGTIVAVRYLFLPIPSTQHLAPSTQPEPALPLPDKPSVAVLPFINMSGDPEQEYFSDGITEVLITDLSKLSGLFVIARNSVFTYKGKSVKIEEVSRELGVRYVLEGSVQKAGDKIRITTQLVDATTGHHMWAERYDRELQDIFALQDEVTQKIVAALEVKLTEGEQGRIWRRYTDNLEAYDSFLRGLEYLGRFTKEANAQARQMFEKALDLDPKFAAAYADLGFTHWWDWISLWSQDPQSLEQAFALAQRAIALDESLPNAHVVLGLVYLSNKQHDRAIAEAERAIVLDPNEADGYAALATILNFAGRPEEAFGLVEKAMRLNPRFAAFYLLPLGHTYWVLGRNEEAVAALTRFLVRYPKHPGAHALLAAVYSELGREKEARVEMAEVVRLSPRGSPEVARQRLPYKDPAVGERFLNAWGKAWSTIPIFWLVFLSWLASLVG